AAAMTAWETKAVALANELESQGHLTDPRWRAVIEAVPRHLFVPRFYDDDRNLVDSADPDHYDRWLSAVYSDIPLVTQITRVPDTDLDLFTSSSSMPSLMVGMLELLSVADGHRVLEIGTGTGYNAALLSHRLGATNVTSIDLDPGLVSNARERLAGIGYRPHLVTGDGAAGVSERAPYDSIIATCAVPTIPSAWITQVIEGGAILADVRGEVSGALMLLRKTSPDAVTGRVLARSGTFMWLRARVDNPLRDGGRYPTIFDLDGAESRLTDINPQLIDDQDFRFVWQRHAPRLRSVWWDSRDDAAVLKLRADDAAWAEVTAAEAEPGQYAITQGGPHAIWDDVERAAAVWNSLGRPARHRFGLTATVDGNHRYWLDSPDGEHIDAP
ncbi:MAG: methyltransferase domain-containing protein, partial [Pseudonocardiaceae bacterium]